MVGGDGDPARIRGARRAVLTVRSGRRRMYPDVHGGTAEGGVCWTEEQALQWFLRAKVASYANPAQLAGGWRGSGAGRGAGDDDGTSRAAAASGHAVAWVPAIGSVELAALSPQQLAGQRVIYSYSGLTPPASLISLIEHGEAAGVIFFGQNISSEAQIAGVIKQLDQADASPLNPVEAPLLMTDQEGGQVRRLPGRPFLSEKQIGANPLPQAETLATEAGQGAAANLRSVGMNVNLAPVLDVYRQAGDFDDQYGRSYSTDPDVVSVLGSNMIKAQQGGGGAATAKPFPALGAAAADQNTDEGPVTLNLPLATIRNIDEVPFQAAITAGVKL